MATSSTRGGKGNYKHDDAFIDWMADSEQGLYEIVIDPELDDIPFPTKLQWNGDSDTEESPWQVPPPGRRCNGRAYVRDPEGDYIIDKNGKRIMRPCHMWPMRGMTVCLKHGGGVARVKKAAVERMASAMDALTGALIKIGLDETAEPKDRLKAILAAMDRVGIKGGQEIDIKDPGYIDVIKDIFQNKGQQT